MDEKFYRLDICFCVLLDGVLMYYDAKASDVNALQLIKKNINEDKRVIVSEQDALDFACNAVVVKLIKSLIKNPLFS